MPYKDSRQQSAYQNERNKARREKWLAEHGPCAKCGSRDRLEVDHINPLEKVGHNVWSWSEQRRNAELAKCQILCAVCHREKTTAYVSRPLIHGTKAGYTKGCRCPECREAQATYMRQFRLSRQ